MVATAASYTHRGRAFVLGGTFLGAEETETKRQSVGLGIRDKGRDRAYQARETRGL